MTFPLQTRTAQDLMTDPIEERPMLIQGLMGDGLGFLCAAPKSGKSWLAMEIGICVATGTPLWGHQVRKGAVLHLPLEDTYQRITQRLWRLADEVDGNLFFATEADALASGLLDQLADFHESHPDLALVIIDTLQMVRTTSRDYSYSADYRDISELKRFADAHGITILIVHHTRKMGDSDVMNTVSGTNAITGAADFTWVIKRNRNDNDATLTITGRDVEERVADISFRGYRWEMVKEKTAEELAESTVPPCVSAVIGFVADCGHWEGSTNALMEEVGIVGMTAAAFGKNLAQHSKLMRSRGVHYSKRHTNAGSLLTLEFHDEGDGSDSSDG